MKGTKEFYELRDQFEKTVQDMPIYIGGKVERSEENGEHNQWYTHHTKQSDMEDEIVKIYWRISEVAEMLQVRPSTIRFWDLTFDERVHKNGRGDRRFTKEDIQRFTEIHRLVKIERYTLEGARKKLQNG